MAGMNEKDSYTVGGFCLYCTLRCFPSCCRLAPDARIMAGMDQKEGYAVQFIKVVFIPVAMQRRIPWSHRP